MMRCPSLNELPPPLPGRTGWPWTEESPQLPDTMPDGSPWPRVSIVTPSFNQGQYLEETLRSVLLQGYPNLEYIVMDGGSTDNSTEIIRSYAPHLAYWRSENDEGQADAINRGFKIASGDILEYINSDDILLAGCLQKVVQFFAEHRDVDCLVGGSVVIDSGGKIVRNRLGLPRIVRGEPETFTRILLRKGLSFNQPATFIKRKAYLAVDGLSPTWTFVMDYDLYFRLARAKPFGHLDELLACFRIHPESKTTLLQDVRRREVEVLHKEHGRDSVGLLPRELGRLYLSLYNFGHNLPIRVGVATGLVTIPHFSRHSARWPS